MRTRTLVIGAVSLALSTGGALLALGCGGGGSRSASGESSSGGEYTGSLTFTNSSSEALCGVEIRQRDGSAVHGERLEPGDSTELEVESTPEFLFATACDGEGYLYAGEVSIDSSSYELTDDGVSRQTFQERLDYLKRLNRMNINPPMSDESVRSQMVQAVELRARDQQWSDTPEAVLIASDQWAVMRNNRTGIITGRRIAGVVGHRFPDGKCTIQIHTFHQGHDGSDFSGPINYEGSAGPIAASNTMVDWMAGVSGGGGSSAASSDSSGGGCTDTCESANDGDCDDGGPGSAYNVCALGTDCGDCGPR